MCRSFVVSAFVVLTGCGAATTSGSTSASCTIEQSDAGVAVLVCKDGTRSIVRAGGASGSCTVRQVDSGAEIRCPDGTHAFVGRVPANGPSDAGNDVTSDAGSDAASDGQVQCPSDLRTDPQNCGACGNVCPAPDHTEARCIERACAPFVCLNGFEDCNGDPTDGCEAEIARDPANCGACGTDCHGAGCFDAKCGDVPENLGGEPSLQALAQDSSRLYAVSCYPFDGARLSAYSKTQKSWTPLTDETFCRSGPGIGSDGTNVYYVNALGHIWRVPVVGGTPTPFFVITGTETITALTADARHVYYVAEENTARGPVKSIHGLPTVPNASTFAIPTTVNDIDADSGFLYWTGATPAFGSVGINRIAADGGKPVVVAQASGRNEVGHMRAVGPWVTWNESFQVPAGTSSEYRMSVRKAPSSGGTAVTLFESSSLGVSAFDADSTAVYVSSGFRVLRVPLSGEEPVAVAVTNEGTTQLVVDDTHVYWIEGGALWRVKKP